MEKIGINWGLVIAQISNGAFCIVVIFIIGLVIYRLIRGFPSRR